MYHHDGTEVTCKRRIPRLQAKYGVPIHTREVDDHGQPCATLRYVGVISASMLGSRSETEARFSGSAVNGESMTVLIDNVK